MIIQSNKITLRSFNLEDAYEFYEMVHNDSAIEKYVPYAYVHNMTETIENIYYYAQGNCINDFYLVIEIENVMVGAIIAVGTFPTTLDLSLIISKRYRGQGIMRDALEIFIKWLKSNTSYKRLSLVIKNDNLASINLARKFNIKLANEGSDSRTYILSI